MKKICLVVGNTLPVPAVMGGAIEELVTVLLEQNEIEKKIELVVFSKANEQAEKMAERYKNSEVIFVPEDNFIDKVNNRIRRYLSVFFKPGFLTDSGYCRKVYKELKKRSFDAVVSEGVLQEQFRRYATKFGKEKMYLHIHHHILADPAFDDVYGNIIAVSEFVKKEWMRTTKQKNTKYHVVYNCVNEDKFLKRISLEERNTLRRKLDISESDFVVLYCGRIQDVKGVKQLLQAFSMIKKKDIKLLIIGNADFAVNTQTPFLKEVESFVQRDLERIKFTGYIENAELYQYYQCADVQVIPSMWEEAAGLVAIEGMLSGLPLIVTKSGGLVEYAPAHVALQVDRKNIVEELKTSITMLYDNPEKLREMSEASREHAKIFTRSQYYNSYIKAFL